MGGRQLNNLKDKIKNNYSNYLAILFIVIAICIVKYVLFTGPQPGVADQGDFDRVMSAGGISLLNSDISNPDFKRFYDYTVTNYSIDGNSIIQFFITLVGTSVGYLIYLISRVCNIFGQTIFKTQYLAIAYSIIYIFALYMIIKKVNIKSKVVLTIMATLGIVIFLDGNYLIWFNSLYGEPMMIGTLMLFIASYLYYINEKYVLENNNKIFSKIIFMFIAAFLFMGSKMQTLTALPVILLILGKIIWDNKSYLSKKRLIGLGVFFVLLIVYPLQMSAQNGAMSKDTQYNSVFYGVLNESETPKEDLEDLGLNPDMYVEAGKHSYLSPDEYVKYVPRTEITEEEFYSKMSNGKLAKFYLTHPMRLIQGMEYTANHAFSTGTGLGKYSREYSEEPIVEFNKFTTWSDFRLSKFPKTLWFIIGIYALMVIISVYEYIKNKYNNEVKGKIHILWTLIFISTLQFPMPFVGNGRADTSKQLYLFNFIFDILIVISIYWVISNFIRLFNKNILEKTT